MKKHKIMLILGGLTLAAAVATTAQADPPDDGNCPAAYDEIRVNRADDKEAAREADENGDHRVCERRTPGGDPYIDNDLRGNP